MSIFFLHGFIGTSTNQKKAFAKMTHDGVSLYIIYQINIYIYIYTYIHM